jgi:pimeloyl-ACP methyl ester carboxylesterase
MKRLLAALVLGASLIQPALAADTTLHVDAAYVTKSGSGKRAVIFIPGLGSGAYVWDGVAPEVAKNYTVYTLTFAGFDGEPPVQPPYIDAFTQSVKDLIAQEKLVKPLLVGHSLGGVVALKLAETMPDTLGGVLLLDSLPIFPPPQAGETPQTRAAGAAQVRDQILAATPDQYQSYVHSFSIQFVSDAKNADLVATRSLKSDRATFAGAFYELTLTDLRPALAKVTVPVELLMPAPSQTYEPQIAAFYSQLYLGTKDFTLVPVVPSKHFLMYDAPDKFQAALDAFLAKYGPVKYAP